MYQETMCTKIAKCTQISLISSQEQSQELYRNRREKKNHALCQKKSTATEEIWNTFLSTFTPSYPIYSSLFSSVTKIFEPPDFSSCEVTFPKSSISTQKYISKLHSSMLLSLKEKKMQLLQYKQKKSIKLHRQENNLQTLSKLRSCKIQYQQILGP